MELPKSLAPSPIAKSKRTGLCKFCSKSLLKSNMARHVKQHFTAYKTATLENHIVIWVPVYVEVNPIIPSSPAAAAAPLPPPRGGGGGPRSPKDQRFGLRRRCSTRLWQS